jgi:hypothetical protein
MRIIRWLLAAAALTIGLAVSAGPAGASSLAVAQPTETVGDTLTVSATLVTIVLGIFAPLVTGLLVRATNPAWVKLLVAGLVGTVLSAFQQAVQADGSAVLSGPWLLQVALLLAAQFGTYFAVWQPLAGGELNRKLGPGVINVSSRPTLR